MCRTWARLRPQLRRSRQKVLGDEVGLALDCGPGWVVKDAIRFARAVEPLHLAWLEDLITGDYEPYPKAQVFKQVTESTSTPIHTGEELYLRENCMELIKTQAVNVPGGPRRMWAESPN
jgi:L-alanine-DL-glutamate epimerase-like enolase superfamily enzyme